jgi:hypothetical protein
MRTRQLLATTMTQLGRIPTVLNSSSLLVRRRITTMVVMLLSLAELEPPDSVLMSTPRIVVTPILLLPEPLSLFRTLRTLVCSLVLLRQLPPLRLSDLTP